MGTSLVEIVATLQAKRRYFTTNQLIRPTEWNKKKKETIIPYINTVIAKQYNELKDFSEMWFVLHKNFTLQDFDNFNTPTPKPSKLLFTFTDFFKEQLEFEKKKLAYITYRQQRKAYEYLKQVKTKVEFSDLTFGLVEEFDQFLRNRGLSQNTIHKKHIELKKYIVLATKHDYLQINQNPYHKFKSWKEPVETMYLTYEERKRLENLTFEAEDKYLLKMAKDMFLIGCFTGLRFSDINALTDSNFDTTEKGLMLRYKAQKTDKTDGLPLWALFSGKPQIICQKYINNGKRRLFQGMTNPKVNKALKELAKLANINKSLHFHASRHTFGSDMVNSVPITTVQGLMGHSDLRTTKGYLHLANEERTKILEQNPID